jgi:hypothetical protein
VPTASIPPAAAQPILAGSSHPELARDNLSMVGNDALWVTIPRTGVAPLDVKLPAVRLVPGTLSASARRLDGPAPAALFVIPDGYGPSGFQAAGVTFPEAGCWEITYSVAGQDLRFTLLVEG